MIPHGQFLRCLYEGRMNVQATVLEAGFLQVTGFCGDGRGVIQPNNFPDTELVLKLTGSPESGGCSL
jgi:hypothetical protein